MRGDEDPELEDFLNRSARSLGLSVNAVLRRVLHVDSLVTTPKFQQLFASATPELIELVRELDLQLRIRNPGLHYVYRETYIGFRREGGHGWPVLSKRSQVFVSVIRRSEELRLVLPVDPTPHLKTPGCRALARRGHHGIGDLQFEIANAQDIARFLAEFDSWLRPMAADTSNIL